MNNRPHKTVDDYSVSTIDGNVYNLEVLQREERFPCYRAIGVFVCIRCLAIERMCELLTGFSLKAFMEHYMRARV